MARNKKKSKKSNVPKVLVYDIETAPILANVWALFDQNVGLNMIEMDWFVMAWAAKWLKGQDGTVYGPHSRVMYADQRKAKDVEDDRKILEEIWKLLDEADVVITQNGKSFDEKKLNARFILNGMKPPSPFKHIDTKQIAKSRFKFTSNKLEYMTDKLNTKYKKLKHGKYPGYALWKACLTGDKKAWKEMERYNKYDVLSTEELYLNLQPWAKGANHVDFSLYNVDSTDVKCNCGSTNLQKRGYMYTGTGKYQRYQCTDCGTWSKSKTNLLSKEKRRSLRGK